MGYNELKPTRSNHEEVRIFQVRPRRHTRDRHGRTLADLDLRA